MALAGASSSQVFVSTNELAPFMVACGHALSGGAANLRVILLTCIGAPYQLSSIFPKCELVL